MANTIDIIIKAAAQGLDAVKAGVSSMFQSIEKNLDKHIKGMDRINAFGAKIGEAFTPYLKAAKAVAAGIAAVGATVVSFGGLALKAYADAQKADSDLANAIKTNGQEVDALVPKYGALAAAIQDQTGKSDESTKAIITTLTNLGIMPAAMEEATRGTIGLSKALGIDTTAAAKAAAMAMEGNYSMLQRYVPALREASTEEEKAAIVKKLMAAGYEQQAASLNTLTGRWGEFRERIGDALEVIGQHIEQSTGLGDVLAGLSNKVKELTANFAAWADAGGINRLAMGVKLFALEFADSFANIGTIATGTFKMIYDSGAAPFRYLGNIIGTTVAAAVVELEYLADVAKAVFAEIKNPIRNDFTMPSRAAANDAKGQARAAFTDTGAFDRIADDYRDMQDSLSDREKRHAANLENVRTSFEKAEDARIAKQAEAQKKAADALVESTFGAQSKADEKNGEAKGEIAGAIVETVAVKEAEATAANLEVKKAAELAIVEEVAAKQRELWGVDGSGGSDTAGTVQVDPNTRNYSQTAIQMQRDMVKAQMEGMAETLGKMFEKANAPLIAVLEKIEGHTKSTAESIDEAITMS